MKRILLAAFFVFLNGCAGDPIERSDTLLQESMEATASTTLEENTMTTTTNMAEGLFIAKAGDVLPGSSHVFEYDNQKAILVNINGSYLAYVNKCTHQGCAFKLQGGVFKCPCHASEFDPLTGEALKGPAKKPLKAIEVSVIDGGVYVR